MDTAVKSGGKPYRNTDSTKTRNALRWTQAENTSPKFVLANRNSSICCSFSVAAASSSSFFCCWSASSSYLKSRTMKLCHLVSPFVRFLLSFVHHLPLFSGFLRKFVHDALEQGHGKQAVFVIFRDFSKYSTLLQVLPSNNKYLQGHLHGWTWNNHGC